GPMKPAQALDLFSARLRRQLDTAEIAMATKVAATVDHNPFVLEHIAGAVARGRTWDEAGRSLADAEALVSLDPQPVRRRGNPKLNAALRVTVDGLDDYPDGRAIAGAFARLGTLHPRAAFTAAMAATLWDVSEETAGEYITVL